MRKFIIDTHLKKEEIIKAIISGNESYRNIAKRFGLSAAAITRYLKDRLYQKIVSAKAEEGGKAKGQVIDRIEKAIDDIQKVYDACDEWLTDPDNPARYELGSREHEINVVYQEKNGIKRKASLKTLLNRLGPEKANLDLEIKIVD
jgi:transposase